MSNYTIKLGSCMARFNLDPDNHKKDAPELWMNFPVPQYMPENLTTLNAFVERDWVSIPSGYADALYSQWLYFVILVNQTANGPRLSLWTSREDAEHIKKYPIIMVQSLTMDEEKAERLSYFKDGTAPCIRILRPLPSAGAGSGGLICKIDKTGEDRAILGGYWLRELPKKASTSWDAKNDLVMSAIPERLRNRLYMDLHEVILYNPTPDYKRYFPDNSGLTPEEQLEIYLEASRDLIDYNAIISSPGYMDTLREVRRHMKDLAKAYKQHHEKQKKQSIPHIPNAFGGIKETGNIWLTPPIATAVESFTSTATDWKTEEHKTKANMFEQTYTHKWAGGTAQMFQSFKAKDEEEKELALEKFNKELLEMQDLKADFLIAHLAQMYASKPDANGFYYMSAKQFLDYRGTKQKKNKNDPKETTLYTGGHRWEDIAKVNVLRMDTKDYQMRLSAMEIITKEINPNTGRVRRGRAVVSHESALIIYNETIVHAPVHKDGTKGDPVVVAWSYRFGSWADHYKNAHPMIALIFQQILKYHPVRQMWEKRIGRYYTFWFRWNASNPEEQRHYLSIRKVLEVSQLQDKIDYQRAAESRNRFETAMDRLQKDGVLQWKWAYDYEEPQGRGWLEDWLDWKIKVTEPEAISNQYKVIEANARIAKEQAQLTELLDEKKRQNHISLPAKKSRKKNQPKRP